MILNYTILRNLASYNTALSTAFLGFFFLTLSLILYIEVARRCFFIFHLPGFVVRGYTLLLFIFKRSY